MRPYISIFKRENPSIRKNRVPMYHKQRESMNRKPIMPPRYVPLRERLNEHIEDKPATPIVQNIFVFNINVENIEEVLPGILRCIKLGTL